MKELKNRHGGLTAVLVVMVIANLGILAAYLFSLGGTRETLPEIPPWSIPVLIVFGVINLVCAIALFRWKKWGFWGLLVMSVVLFFFNLSFGIGVRGALPGLLGPVILYGVLQLGEEKNGWCQLE
ncbi:MAG: hypothetical protein GY759_12875 [Chloroflexi bacterium]|nr:hypothetical protein [Chloroflexota bacterium]